MLKFRNFAEAKDGDGANIVKDKPFKGKAMKKEPDSGKGISFANMKKSKVAKDADANPNRAKAYGESVKSADKKPETYTKPDGKRGVRMVPVDKEVIKVDEILDRPGAMKSYKDKAKMQSDRARNSATAKIVRGKGDISKEKDTIRKREKGQDMADRAANRHFRKSIGRGYNK